MIEIEPEDQDNNPHCAKDQARVCSSNNQVRHGQERHPQPSSDSACSGHRNRPWAYSGESLCLAAVCWSVVVHVQRPQAVCAVEVPASLRQIEDNIRSVQGRSSLQNVRFGGQLLVCKRIQLHLIRVELKRHQLSRLYPSLAPGADMTPDCDICQESTPSSLREDSQAASNCLSCCAAAARQSNIWRVA